MTRLHPPPRQPHTLARASPWIGNLLARLKPRRRPGISAPWALRATVRGPRFDQNAWFSLLSSCSWEDGQGGRNQEQAALVRCQR